MTPLRLPPGTDLKQALQALVDEPAWAAGAFVVAGIGSLHDARLRLAAAEAATEITGPCELLSLQGTLSVDGVHLHLAVADAQGRVWGGHLLDGNRIRTTAELLLAPMTAWQLGRAPDSATGYAELVVQPRR